MPRPNSTQRELLNDVVFDPIESFRAELMPRPKWDSIVDFATHRSFCGLRLYPRQLTLLKLIYLETENMTAYDLDVIEQWRSGFTNKEAEGVQPDIWARVDYLKNRGYRHFPHIEAIIGRRGSKGKIGGVLGAEKLAFLYSLGDWQDHYGVSPGKDGYLSVVATNSIQAKKFQFADIRETVLQCAYLQKAVATANEYELVIRTPGDLRRIAWMAKNKIPIDHRVATLHAIAMSSNSASGRGATGFANFFDEFAHMITGTGSNRSSEEVYEAYQPSLDQFGKDSLTYIPSSPFCLAPETPVLTEDLRWVPVGALRLGDKLIGFDEHAPSQAGKGRRWRQAEVTETSIIRAPRYTIKMASGREIVSTSEHLWLTSWASQKSRWDWRKTAELKPGDRIKSLGVDPWSEDDSREAGYLAGFFDGEGHLSGQAGRNMTLGFTQNRGPVRDRVVALLNERGHKVQDYTDETAKLSKVRVGGCIGDIMRFLGTVRPERLLPKFHDMFYGTRIYGPASPAVDTVVSVEYKDEGDVVALGTSTATLVADGLLSHNTQVGHFYSLYQEGSVLMSSYDPDTGEHRIERRTAAQLGTTRDEAEERFVEQTANPEMLIVQLPSWGLYEDWQRGPELVGRKFRGAIQVYNEKMMRLEKANPEKFRVERRSQFAAVTDAFFNPQKVEEMFAPVDWREPVVPQDRGRLDRKYRIHIDPGLSNANMALCVGHLEDGPPDEEGEVWPHVVIDYLKVWKPEDYPDHTIDYVAVQREIADVIRRFPSTTEVSFDDWNSAGMIAGLKQEFKETHPHITIRVEHFTEVANQIRMDRMKSAVNLGWVHSYRDTFYGEGQCLLELEMKFLQKVGKKVVKQDFGPVTTKDLFDAANVVVDSLLGAELDKWQAKMLGITSPRFGSTNAAAVRSGRELGRLSSMQGQHGVTSARERMNALSSEAQNRLRGGFSGRGSRLRGR